MKTILVVDDDQDLRELISVELQSSGYQVFEAENGRKAFQVVMNEKIDVVISDVRMPNGDGVELLNQVKTRHAKVPTVILVTGFAGLTIEDAYNQGAYRMIKKPFTFADLIATLESSVLPNSEKLAKPIPTSERDLKVDLQFTDYAHAVSTQSLRIGQGGMFVKMENPQAFLSQNVNFNIQFQIGELEGLSGQGQIRWVRSTSNNGLPSGIGIEFGYIDAKYQKSMFAFLDQLQEKAFIPKN